ncbi:hypothetical protein [Nocardioides humi]|uniref:Uncharacterized protein n=1 Tax=Nocardioides humi TaxID=449461 RepID=A0ABN2BAF3_9ACTN|nr:hypothetical protein [Nocardioides humi]
MIGVFEIRLGTPRLRHKVRVESPEEAVRLVDELRSEIERGVLRWTP